MLKSFVCFSLELQRDVLDFRLVVSEIQSRNDVRQDECIPSLISIVSESKNKLEKNK